MSARVTVTSSACFYSMPKTIRSMPKRTPTHAIRVFVAESMPIKLSYLHHDEMTRWNYSIRTTHWPQWSPLDLRWSLWKKIRLFIWDLCSSPKLGPATNQTRRNPKHTKLLNKSVSQSHHNSFGGRTDIAPYLLATSSVACELQGRTTCGPRPCIRSAASICVINQSHRQVGRGFSFGCLYPDSVKWTDIFWFRNTMAYKYTVYSRWHANP